MKALSRRLFLQKGSQAAASSAVFATFPKLTLASSLAAAPGIQLFTVLKELSEDLSGTLAKLAAIGYRSVESAGMAGKSATEFRKALDQAGLKCPSSHLFLEPGQSAAEYFTAINILGSEYAVTSILLPPGAQIKSAEDYGRFVESLTQDEYKRMVGDVNTLARQAQSAGLKLAYHNHNMEFRKWPDGSTGYQILMSGLDPSLVKIELDCGWADLAGQSSLKLFKQYPGRIKMLHLKDFIRVGHPVTSHTQGTNPVWTLLGSGHIDYPSILTAATKVGVEFIFVEQEPPYVKFTALEAAKANFDYLRSIA